MPTAALANSLAPFQLQLFGTWTNQALPDAPNGQGGTSNPLSFNLMPLPQSAPQGTQDTRYILKNCTVTEEVLFYGAAGDPPPTTAANRGAEALQLPTAMYYEQQVFFGPKGPGSGGTVHTENGSWLHMTRGKVVDGPYVEMAVDEALPQPDFSIAKQMSVPHGNSILALGNFDPASTAVPQIPDTNSTLPFSPDGATLPDTTPYTETLDAQDNYQNPFPQYTKNPNLPLQQAVAILQPTNTMHWHVTTAVGDNGSSSDNLMNIPFEHRNAKVSLYFADYWLMSTDGGVNYDYLAYSQWMNLDAQVPDGTLSFPHVTTNVLTRVRVEG